MINEEATQEEAPTQKPTATQVGTRTLGDVYLDDLKISIRCRGCGAREAAYPQDMPGFPDQPVEALTRRRVCPHCYSKHFEVTEVWWCEGLIKRGPENEG